MSKIHELREMLRGRHCMSNTDADGLRDYHAAKEAINKSRVRDPYRKLAAIKHALKNYSVRVTLGPVNDVLITENADGTGYYTVL